MKLLQFLVLCCLVTVTWSARSLAEPRCVAPRDVLSLALVPGDRFTLRLTVSKKSRVEAIQNPKVVHELDPSENTSLGDLSFGEGSEWTLSQEGSDSKCRIDFRDFWASTPPRIVPVGFAGGEVPASRMSTVLPRVERTDASYPLIIAPSAGPRRAGVVACPEGELREWSSGALPLPAAAKPAHFDLLARLGGPNRPCVPVARLMPDDRRLLVQLGDLEAATGVASVVDLETPEFERSVIRCRVRVDDGSWSPCSDESEQIPRAADFPARSVPHWRRRVAVRLLSTPPPDGRCPLAAPDPQQVAVAISSKLFACLYRETSEGGLGLFSGRGLLFRYEPCLARDGQCAPSRPPQRAEAPWELDVSEGERLSVKLRVRPAGSDLTGLPTRETSILVQGVPVRRSDVLAKTIHERVYVAATPTMFGSSAFVKRKHLCVPAFSGEDSQLAGELSAHVGAELGGVVIPSRSSGGKLAWTREGQQLCPAEFRPMEFTRELLVRFYLGEHIYRTHTLVEDAGLQVAKVVPYDGLEGPEQPVRSYGVGFGIFGVKTNIDVGNWLCVEVEDPALRDSSGPIHLGPDRFTFLGSGFADGKREAGTLRRDNFSLEPVRFDRKRKGLYCARLNAEPSLLGVRPDLRAITDPSSTLDVALDDCKTEGCKNSLAYRRSSAGWRLGYGLGAQLLVTPDRAIRLGGGVDVSIFDVGYRLSPAFSAVLRGGLALYVGGLVHGNPEFDSEEAARAPGTCVAGCDDVQDIAQTGVFGAFAGPCLIWRAWRPFLSIPLCGGAGAGMLIDSRSGSGVYRRSDGSIEKVGEKGDSHVSFAPALFASLGFMLNLVE